MAPEPQPIRYGMFVVPLHPPDKSWAQCLAEDLEAVVLAEELGFSEFWIGEHHAFRQPTVVMPEMFIARALGQTSRIRLGPAPVCLQYHHPAHVACRLAMLDHMSAGRLNLAFGPGSVPSDAELYGLDLRQGAEMVDEAIDMILQLWSQDPPYDIPGKYWNIKLERFVDADNGLGYIPRPLQQPHPPVVVPGASRSSPSMRMAARRGFWPLSHFLVAGNTVANIWQTYETAALEAGRQPSRADWRVARSIFLADTTEEAVRRARSNSLGQSYDYFVGLADRGPGRAKFKRDATMSDADCHMDYFLSEQIIAGDVDEVLRRLLALIEEIGTFGTLVLMGYDWDDRPSWIRSMELFARELMPALNKAVGPVPV